MSENRFEVARQLFDSGEYFEAHEVWEELWNETFGARHAFLQGLIQVAAALHHAQNGNWRGTRKLFASSLGYLEKGLSDSEPVDMKTLKDKVLDFAVLLDSLEAGEDVVPPFFKLPMR